MRFDLLIFDLDGTLIDSCLDLALAVNAARANAGMAPIEHERIYSYVGNGAPTLVRRSLGDGVSDAIVEESLAFFYEYYREHMLDNTGLYPGVQEGLDQLLAQGARMAVLTNKPVRFSQIIVDRLGLNAHFREVYGGNSFETKKPDPFGLNRLVEELGATKATTLMVGDSAVDIDTARNAGVASCGGSYGLQPESFETSPPDVLVDRFDQVVRVASNGELARFSRHVAG